MVSWLDRLRAALAPGIVVERPLASGGMGHVALGQDVVLARPVAIKVLKPELVTAVRAERFLREAKSAAGLYHPNVVLVHRGGEADGLPYYIMDYLPGDTLATRLDRGHLAPREVVRLGLDLLSALGAAHARKLIHRDVKPANIFLVGGRALLTDFGIAYALDSELTTLTRDGELPATIAYISPEQLHDQPVTEATDIYATGLVLYEAATGSRWQPLTPPADGNWAKVPGFLRPPLRKALQLKPDDRWPKAAAFAQALASAERRYLRNRLLGVAAGMAAALGLLAWWGPRSPCFRHCELPVDLVVAPFAVDGLPDSSLGPRLANLTAWSVQMLSDLRVAPRDRIAGAWKGPGNAPKDRVYDLMRSARSEYGAYALLRARGPRLEARLLVIGRDKATLFQGSFTADPMDRAALADSIALIMVSAVLADRMPHELPADVPLPARTEFQAGEEAFARDAWLTAERHYLRALELDSDFVLAAWRLGNARRWMPLRPGPPYPPGLYQMFRADRSSVGDVDGYLIEAQFRPSGAARFAEYEKAVHLARRDPYPALLYGDELFHRGALAGRPLARRGADAGARRRSRLHAGAGLGAPRLGLASGSATRLKRPRRSRGWSGSRVGPRSRRSISRSSCGSPTSFALVARLRGTSPPVSSPPRARCRWPRAGRCRSTSLRRKSSWAAPWPRWAKAGDSEPPAESPRASRWSRSGVRVRRSPHSTRLRCFSLARRRRRSRPRSGGSCLQHLACPASLRPSGSTAGRCSGSWRRTRCSVRAPHGRWRSMP